MKIGKRTPSVGSVAFIATSVLSLGMCSVEHVGSVSQEITTGSPEFFVNDFIMANPGPVGGYPNPPPNSVTYPEAQEAFIVRVVMPNMSERLVMGFNDWDLNRQRRNPITPLGTNTLFNTMGWASANLTNPFSWEYCNAFAPLGTRGSICGLTETPLTPDGNVVPRAPGQDFFAGDPILLATGSPDGWVGYVQMAHATADGPQPNRFIIISHSLDGGRSFRSTDVVNVGAVCSTGDQDMPHATVDVTVSPPKLWIAWRHKSGGSFDKVCVANADVNTSTGTISNIAVQQMQNLSFSNNVGGVMVQAGGGKATVFYSNTTDGQPSMFGQSCPKKPMTWLSGTLDIATNVWGPAVTVQTTQDFSWCPAGGFIANTLRAFGFVRLVTGEYYAATNRAQDRIDIFRSTDQGATWTFMTSFSAGITQHKSLFFPALASDGANRLGLVYYGTNSNDTTARALFRGAPAAGTNGWDPEFGLTPSRPRPQTVSDGVVPPGRSWGDYVSMATKPFIGDNPTVETFFPAWTSWDPVNGQGNSTAKVPFERVEYERLSVHF